MKNVPMNNFMIRAMRGLISFLREGWSSSSRFSIYHQAMLLALITLLSLGTWAIILVQADAYGANPGPGKVCEWYTVLTGNSLGRISHNYHSSAKSLAHVNHITNINRIFIGQRLCIPTIANHRSGGTASGLLPNGSVRSFAYNALEQSSPSQVASLLRQTAARHGLPANLLMAIAWQESGWNQHVIAHDGGIGTMQIMPSTAQGLNRQVRGHYDPYKLQDNIELGAIYLHSLWQGFHGNQTKVISAYNQGGWSVTHQGISNWSYVRSVQALMQRY
ncbi:MAG TPA: transglycosylase SLT domain-containing protein [Ktedonobacteraceae bacterium]